MAESHALGRRVMCHALGGPGLRTALEAGVDSIEHGCYLDEDPELMAQMAEQGTFFVPTLTVYVYHRESPAPHVRERAHALHPHHVASVRAGARAGRADRGGHRRGRPRPSEERARARSTWWRRASRRCRRCARPPSGRPRCLGLEREVGTIEKGRLADLVVVDGNPLDDITVLLDPARIELVFKGGAVCADRRPPLRPRMFSAPARRRRRATVRPVWLGVPFLRPSTNRPRQSSPQNRCTSIPRSFRHVSHFIVGMLPL